MCSTSRKEIWGSRIPGDPQGSLFYMSNEKLFTYPVVFTDDGIDDGRYGKDVGQRQNVRHPEHQLVVRRQELKNTGRVKTWEQGYTLFFIRIG